MDDFFASTHSHIMFVRLLCLMVLLHGSCGENLEVRLVDGSNDNEGRVEVKYRYKWGTICHLSWDANDAKVVCRQLGFPHEKAVAVGGDKFGEGPGVGNLESVDCLGSESNLGDCAFQDFEFINCPFREAAAGVICTNETPLVRLVGGSNSNEERVELSFNNVWGTVCDDDWDANDAKVVCRQLGRPHENAVAVGSTVFGEGSGRIWLDNVHCLGSENNLSDCNRSIQVICRHNEDAGVICSNVSISLQVRLVGGINSNEGRVEVLFNNVWGTVSSCDGNWGDRDANVVCRQMGLQYDDGYGRNPYHKFGKGSGPVWLSGLNCFGSEGNLSECSHSGLYGIDNCGHDADAGVKCNKTITTDIFQTSSMSIPTAKSTSEDMDGELGELADVTVTPNNVLEVAQYTSVLVGSSLEIDDDDVEDISSILTNIVAVKAPSLDVTEAVVETVDSIIEYYVRETSLENEVLLIPEAPNQIQRTLEQQISTLQTSPGNVTIKERNLVVQAVKIPAESIVSRRLVFEVTPDGQNKTLSTKVKTLEAGEESEADVEATISFQLSTDILSNNYDNTSLPVSFVVYNDATLFPSTLLANKSSGDEDKDNVKHIVASFVISATVEGNDVKNLPKDNPVITIFALNKVNKYEGEIDNNNAIACVFWDITANNGLGDWSREGCQYIRQFSDRRVVCHCNHLTSFAVLMDIHGKTSIGLDIVSKVGCGISITCLLITLITYLSSRRLRKVKPKQITISLCFSLLFLYVVFVIGIERGIRPDAWCITVSALLHYFTLTSIAWMAVEAFHMFCSFVRVVGRWAHISRFLMKASLVAWGLPAVIVIVVLIADVNQYNNKEYCFLKIGYAFYFTHLLFIALVVGVNAVIFGLVMHSLMCGRKTHSTQHNRGETLRRVQNAIAISLLMGLTWVFGLFSLIHEDSSFVFQVFFCIFNSLQGAFIFVLFCVRQPDIVAIYIYIYIQCVSQKM